MALYDSQRILPPEILGKKVSLAPQFAKTLIANKVLKSLFTEVHFITVQFCSSSRCLQKMLCTGRLRVDVQSFTFLFTYMLLKKGNPKNEALPFKCSSQ